MKKIISVVGARLNFIKIASIHRSFKKYSKDLKHQICSTGQHFDAKMPEEVNRVLTDHISEYLFVTEKSGITNLKNEGIDDSKVYFTGNVMIDSLLNFLPHINKSKRGKFLNYGMAKALNA